VKASDESWEMAAIEKQKVLDIWTDGSHSGYGVVIRDEAGETLRELAGSAPADVVDQSDTEYLAVILALREAHHLEATAVRIHSDSKFLVDQMNGNARVRSSLMAKYHEQAVAAASGLEAEFIHIPGAENGVADRLSRTLPRIGSSEG
jgi:ribonuclease HI